MFKKFNPHHLLLHLIVFIWGWSPILGKGISAGAFQLVWMRIAITVAMMGIYLLIIKATISISLKKMMQLSGIGVIICVHWLCFYGAIKVSNVSVTMAAFSTGTFFTALIEPLVYKRKILVYELIIGLIIIGAICFIFSVEIQFGLGILLGVLAALTASIFSVFNGVLIQDKINPITSSVLSFFELAAALLGFSIFLIFSGDLSTSFFNVSSQDLLLISILAGVCTVYPFIASVNLMKYLSPYTINLTVNLEGVYGVILASIIFNENKELSANFYIGFTVILLVVFLNAFIKQKQNSSSTSQSQAS